MTSIRKTIGTLVAVVVLAVAGCEKSSDEAGQEPAVYTYAALGASDAVGFGAFPLSQGYVYLIESQVAELRETVRLQNCGILDARIEDFVDSELPRAIAANPNLVTVWAGANDIWAGKDPAVFEAGLRTLLQELREHTDAVIFVGDLVDLLSAPIFRREPSSNVTRDRINDYNRRIARVAAETGCVLVRLSDMPLDQSLFAADGFHPNNNGYRLMAGYFLAEIEPRL